MYMCTFGRISQPLLLVGRCAREAFVCVRLEMGKFVVFCFVLLEYRGGDACREGSRTRESRKGRKAVRERDQGNLAVSNGGRRERRGRARLRVVCWGKAIKTLPSQTKRERERGASGRGGGVGEAADRAGPCESGSHLVAKNHGLRPSVPPRVVWVWLLSRWNLQSGKRGGKKHKRKKKNRENKRSAVMWRLRSRPRLGSVRWLRDRSVG